LSKGPPPLRWSHKNKKVEGLMKSVEIEDHGDAEIDNGEGDHRVMTRII
jgi:hypothetical protein